MWDDQEKRLIPLKHQRAALRACYRPYPVTAPYCLEGLGRIQFALDTNISLSHHIAGTQEGKGKTPLAWIGNLSVLPPSRGWGAFWMGHEAEAAVIRKIKEGGILVINL